MHDFLASEYDTENVVVTKTKLRQQESPQMLQFFSPKNSTTNQSAITKLRLNRDDSNPTENVFSGPTDNVLSGPTDNLLSGPTEKAFSGEND